MDFDYSPRTLEIQSKLQAFMEAYIYPRIHDYDQEIAGRNFPVCFMEDLKALARAEGLWNMFLPALRDEEVYLRSYASVSEARAGIGRYLTFYNGRRPHSSLDGKTPDQAYFNQPMPAAVAA